MEKERERERKNKNKKRRERERGSAEQGVTGTASPGSASDHRA